MLAIVKEVSKPLLVAAMAIIMAHCGTGCVPPFGRMADLEDSYNKEITTCTVSTKTLTGACVCKMAVNERYGLCDHPEWPRFGQCDERCK